MIIFGVLEITFIMLGGFSFLGFLLASAILLFASYDEVPLDKDEFLYGTAKHLEKQNERFQAHQSIAAKSKAGHFGDLFAKMFTLCFVLALTTFGIDWLVSQYLSVDPGWEHFYRDGQRQP